MNLWPCGSHLRPFWLFTFYPFFFIKRIKTSSIISNLPMHCKISHTKSALTRAYGLGVESFFECENAMTSFIRTNTGMRSANVHKRRTRWTDFLYHWIYLIQSRLRLMINPRLRRIGGKFEIGDNLSCVKGYSSQNSGFQLIWQPRINRRWHVVSRIWTMMSFHFEWLESERKNPPCWKPKGRKVWVLFFGRENDFMF
jgi:hypothetical protein